MIYLSGIDTLIIGFYLTEFKLTDEEWKSLSDAKERAKAPVFRSSGSLIEFKGIYLVMRPSGINPYTYVMQGDDFSLRLAQKISKNKFPEIFVEFRSQFLWRFGYKNAYSFIKEWISNWTEIKSDVVSRADLTADVSGFPDIKIENIVTRARQRKEYYKFEPIRDGQFYFYGSKHTGYAFGSGPLMIRIYNKTLEAKKSRKEWFHELWKEGGWDGSSDITRVEMQLQREFLKDFNVTTFESFQDALGDIFRYITQDWFSLRLPSDDKNRARWPINPFWSEFQGAINNFGEIYGQIRGKIKQAKETLLIPQAVGLITSIGALRESFAFGDLFAEINRYLRKKGLKLEDAIQEKRKRRSMFEDCYEPF